MVNDRPYDYIVSIPKIEQKVKLQEEILNFQNQLWNFRVFRDSEFF